MQQHSFSKLRFCSFLKDVCSAGSTPHHFVPLLTMCLTPLLNRVFCVETQNGSVWLGEAGIKRSSSHWQNHWDVHYQKVFVDSPHQNTHIFHSERETSLLITLKIFSDFIHSVFICKTFACNLNGL